MAQTVVKDVKSKGQVVGQVEVELFDNLDEAEESLGEEECVRLINKIRTIEIMDDARRKAIGGSGTGVRALMKALKERPEVIEELMERLGLKQD